MPRDGTVTWVASVRQPSKPPVQGARVSTECWEVQSRLLAPKPRGKDGVTAFWRGVRRLSGRMQPNWLS
jgi:hypothetical protein